MSRVLVIGERGDGAPAAEACARALAMQGAAVERVDVGAGPGSVLLAAARARRRRAVDAVLSVSGSGAAHVAARLSVRSRQRWLAFAAAPLALGGGRWQRVFDPRTRALRRADAAWSAEEALDSLHARGGVAVAGIGGATEVAGAVLASSPRAGDRARILMLGTVNTPHVEHMAEAMQARGHEVVVAGDVAAAYPPSVLPGAGVPVRALELPAHLWIRRLRRRDRPDVTHANWVPAYGFLAALARMRPLVVMAWGSDIYGAGPRQRRMARYALRRADVAMADSRDLLERLVELGASRERTHLLNWGVDLERFAPPADRQAERARLGLGRGPMVLSPRALAALYNPQVIAEAFARVAPEVEGAQLVLKHIGSQDAAADFPLPPGARVVGHLPYEQLPAYYRAADICVSIPRSDSSPRSVWEAMACGCACVLSDLPWVHELIEDGRHALVVAPEPDAVADALRRLLLEEGLAARLGAAARALVEAHRDQRKEMDRLSELYEGLRRAG